jgi:hypothetical protein
MPSESSLYLRFAKLLLIAMLEATSVLTPYICVAILSLYPLILYCSAFLALSDQQR